ncbi:ATP-grasp domain-containing protein [Zavarzinella formosa]|uniref:ATP-grasp domain-containing protein n=1 Tax=Zavarzinella formosa TaxID=360055 RepID=UPI0002E92ABC|nr:ATP-grasp domain-containing protein [Zavarzinella formosa]
MISVLVYEEITVTWAGGDHASLSASLLREGRAMLEAVTADLRKLPGVDCQIATSRELLLSQTTNATHTLLIAPEFDGILHGLAKRVVEAGGTLLGPSPEAIRLTGDKLLLFDWWKRHRVPTPSTWEYDAKPANSPIVVKPRDGAGSQATRLLKPGEIFAEMWAGPLIAQEYVEGISASVALLCGPTGMRPLWPCEQMLSKDGYFAYLGGRTITDAGLSKRATDIAQRAAECVPGLLGYVGVDVVIGDDGRDWAIEINPRLTTSYVGLRAKADTNLMAAILSIVRGEETTVAWRNEGYAFTPDGTVTGFPA